MPIHENFKFSILQTAFKRCRVSLPAKNLQPKSTYTDVSVAWLFVRKQVGYPKIIV